MAFLEVRIFFVTARLIPEGSQILAAWSKTRGQSDRPARAPWKGARIRGRHQARRTMQA
jgi:hypothetical protein